MILRRSPHSIYNIFSLQIYLPLAFRTSAEFIKKQVPCWITQNDSSIRLWNKIGLPDFSKDDFSPLEEAGS